jgi:hypothetical protein
MSEVSKLLDTSIAADGFTIRHANNKAIVDLSKIDFEALAKRFAQSKTKNIETSARGRGPSLGVILTLDPTLFRATPTMRSRIHPCRLTSRNGYVVQFSFFGYER